MDLKMGRRRGRMEGRGEGDERKLDKEGRNLSPKEKDLKEGGNSRKCE